MYAALQCEEEIQEKILTVYDNDGPGFPEGFFYVRDTEKILKKVTRIIPEASCDRYVAYPPERTGDHRQYAERDSAARCFYLGDHGTFFYKKRRFDQKSRDNGSETS